MTKGVGIEAIREGRELKFRDQLRLTVMLSLPAILAQLSSILMQYIDASMVGRLGADDSASIGLVSTSLWLFWGICSAITTGFSVQVAHRLGAGDPGSARSVLRQAITSTIVFSVVVMAIGLAIAGPLPGWLGGEPAIRHQATVYFVVFIAALPLLSLNYLAGGMLRAAGNMKVPSTLNILMCVFDCVFNFFLIFPTREITVAGASVTMPGAGLGVLGAALGTVLAEALTAGLMLYFLCVREKELRINDEKGSFRPRKEVLRKAVGISVPMTVEHAVICGAQIAITVIVAPLGVVAIAANAFAVTAESLCYMPGYGIGDAATTLVGQSYGAGRQNLVRRFGYITVGLGMVVMTVMGLLMYVGAPWVMELMSPVRDIQTLGTEVLRIEAWVEPMFAASIVAYGVFVGVGHTVLPAIMNFGSIWMVRVPLAWWLAEHCGYGLKGVWIAMAIELTFRGILFLSRLISKGWSKPAAGISRARQGEGNLFP